MNERLAFIAIGGNSLIKSKDLQTVEDQHQAIHETTRHVADLIEQGYQVVLNFGKPDEKGSPKMTVAEAEQYIADGHFAPGSMLLKIQSVLRFLRSGGQEVFITSPEFIKGAVLSGQGTHIIQ